MAARKFKIGQRVTVTSKRYAHIGRETYEVVRKLPEEHGIFQYRIKSTADGHERVVLENELT